MSQKENRFGYVEELSDVEVLRSEIRNSNPIANGTIIHYTVKSSSTSKTYAFSAIYREGFWYTTAEHSARVGHRTFMEEISSPEVTSVHILRLDERVK